MTGAVDAGVDRTSLGPAQLRSARWAAGLFGLVVLLQRFAVPQTPVALLVPVVIGWVIAALARGVVVVDQARLTWWFAAAAVTATGMLAQNRFVPGAEISLTAWGLIMAVWLPFTVRLAERGNRAYLIMLRYVTRIAVVLAFLALAMVGSQLLGVPYQDWFATLIPEPLQLGGFSLTYPLTYGSEIYKANAWIGLEPSMVSAQLGLGVLAALFVRARLWMVVVLLLGMLATVSGSGVVIVLVGVGVMAVHRSRRLLVTFLVLTASVVAASTSTPFGELLFARSTEFQSSGSSASLRALEPYAELIPRWVEHLSGMLLGYGPGSSQRLVADTNVLGLLVPSPAKVFFEYGLLSGLVLASFLLICYWGGPSRTFGLSLLFSLWLLQPGTTTMVIVAPLLVLVTLWSPRIGRPIESTPIPGRARRQPVPWSIDARIPGASSVTDADPSAVPVPLHPVTTSAEPVGQLAANQPGRDPNTRAGSP